MKDRNTETRAGYDFGHDENIGGVFIGNGKEGPEYTPSVIDPNLTSDAMRSIVINELRARAEAARKWNIEKEAALKALGSNE